MKIIECKDLTKEYISSDSTVKAVDNVSISFEQGEFCAVTGPSGSGKSTFLHILSSLENATSGYVIYGEKRLSDYSDNQLSILRRRRFGFVFQSYNLEYIFQITKRAQADGIRKHNFAHCCYDKQTKRLTRNT